MIWYTLKSMAEHDLMISTKLKSNIYGDRTSYTAIAKLKKVDTLNQAEKFHKH